jgi:hypothetical protein
MAKAFNKYVAGKVNFTYMRGTEWHANYDDKTRQGEIEILLYDGINVYGDEVQIWSYCLQPQNLFRCRQ